MQPGKILGVNIFVLACFFIGQFFQKIAFFENLPKNKKYIKSVFLGGILATLLLAIIHEIDENVGYFFRDYYDFEFLFFLSQMFVIMAGICWLYIAGKMKSFFSSLQTVGKMTLTNYMVQNLFGLLFFSGFGLGFLHKLPFYTHVLLAVSIYTFQVFFSKYWLSKYQFGPVEWLWRCASYRAWLKIRQ